jgi:cellulose synthase operon protein C
VRPAALIGGLVVGVFLTGPTWAGDLFDDVAQLEGDLSAGDAARRREAVSRLDAYGAKQATPYLERALDDPDLEVRARASAAIGRFGLSALQPRLIAQLGDPEARLRAASADALGRIGALDGKTVERSLPALERALGDSEHEVRSAAVQALGRLPKEALTRVAVAITARLDDENVGVRQHTVAVLQRIGDRRAVIPLIGRLGDSSREVRTAALDALGQLGDERAAPAMLRVLRGTDQPVEVKTQAISALGRLGNKSAVAPLAELLERAADPLRARAAMALGQIASMTASQAGSRQAIDALIAALHRDDARSAAREALARAGTPAVMPLIAHLPAAGGEELAAICELFGELKDARAAGALVDELGRGRVARDRVLEALAQVLRPGSPDGLRAGATLAGLLSDPDPLVRRRAVAALRALHDARAASALVTAAADGDREVRLGAIAELGALKAAGGLAVLASTVERGDLQSAAAAARSLGEIGDARAAPVLVAALDRSELRLRRDAADALARLHTQAAGQLPAVLKLVRTGAPDKRPEAIAALGGILRRRADPIARELCLGYAEAGARGYSSHGESRDELSAALEAVDALAAMRDEAAAPRLLRLLASSDTDLALRRRVAAAMGELGRSPQARTALAGLVDDERDSYLRIEAVWALGKLGDASARPVLERARTGNSLALRQAATSAIARLAKPGPRSDFVTLHLVDFDGTPRPEVRYLITLPDGTVKPGIADPRGTVREESIVPGTCTVELVDDPR